MIARNHNRQKSRGNGQICKLPSRKNSQAHEEYRGLFVKAGIRSADSISHSHCKVQMQHQYHYPLRKDIRDQRNHVSPAYLAQVVSPPKETMPIINQNEYLLSVYTKNRKKMKSMKNEIAELKDRLLNCEKQIRNTCQDNAHLKEALNSVLVLNSKKSSSKNFQEHQGQASFHTVANYQVGIIENNSVDLENEVQPSNLNREQTQGQSSHAGNIEQNLKISSLVSSRKLTPSDTISPPLLQQTKQLTLKKTLFDEQVSSPANPLVYPLVYPRLQESFLMSEALFQVSNSFEPQLLSNMESPPLTPKKSVPLERYHSGKVISPIASKYEKSTNVDKISRVLESLPSQEKIQREPEKRMKSQVEKKENMMGFIK